MTTDLRSLVDPDAGEVSAQIYVDDAIYEAEMRNIFGKSWLFLAHTTMVPNRGDYLSTSMGDDPVVVVNRGDGEYVAFMNQCRHRGMRVCRADEGNARAFTCTYHGWVYDTAGDLVQVPREAEAYGDRLDKSKWGLRRVPKLTNYKGFIFGNWDEQAESFEDYLGDMAWYLDSFVDRYENSVVLGSANRWLIHCNWKFAAEQFATDAYHAETTHAAALIAQGKDWGAVQNQGLQFSAPGGHGTGFFLDEAEDMTNYGPTVEAYHAEARQREIDRLGETRALNVRGHNTVFPNFSFLVGTNTFRVWHPRGPHTLEINSWTLGDADSPDEVREAVRRNAIKTFSSAGLFEAEDSENWAEIQEVLRGRRARTLRFNFSMGLGGARTEEGFPGTINSVWSEEAGRGFYRRWLELMGEAV